MLQLEVFINVQKSEPLFCSRYGYSKTYFVYSQWSSFITHN